MVCTRRVGLSFAERVGDSHLLATSEGYSGEAVASTLLEALLTLSRGVGCLGAVGFGSELFVEDVAPSEAPLTFLIEVG